MQSDKKRILFIMNNLNCGGAEKALVSLLQEMDFSKYEVDLFLFIHEGMFMKQIPRQVNLLPAPLLYPYFNMSLKKAVIENFLAGRFKFVWNRILAGLVYKGKETAAVKEQKVWKFLSNVLPALPKNYDAAIGYLEKTPNYFCVDKVTARIKIGFIHNDYNKLGMDAGIDMPYFKKFSHIFTISELCEQILKANFPGLREKFSVMYNIISPDTLKNMANAPIDFSKKGISLVSVGRLNEQKGFDRAVIVCRILIDMGIDIYWSILGEGEQRETLEQLIAAHRLQGRFMLLGVKENPYPYIKNADVYVQPSRFEGKSIAIDEAKILGKPIVVTDFPSIADQIIHLENGYIVAQDAKAIANGIAAVINDSLLRDRLITNLQSENFSTKNEIGKLYQAINS